MRRGFAAVFWLFSLTFSALAQDYTISGPATAGIRAGVDVIWTGPEAKGGIIEIHPEGENTRRVGYAYVKGSPQAIEAPEEPGAYRVHLFFDGERKASYPMTVEMVSATLSAPATSDAGAEIVVTFSGPINRNDNITFAASGGDPIRGLSYAYAGSSKDGTVKLKAPKDAGTYDIVYVTGSTIIGRAPVTVGSVSAELTVSASIPAGSLTMVGFDGPDNSGDLVTFAARDGDPIRPASYAYVGNSDDGTVVLRAFEDTGPYDIVYVSGGRVIGRSPVDIVPVTMALTAPEEVTALQGFAVQWDGTGNQGDRIIMVAPGQTEGDPYAYIDPLEATVTLVAPEAPGVYDLIYVTRKGRELARRPITVLPAPVRPGALQVLFTPGAGLGPDDGVEVILDASGSMLKRQDGERRIDIAKRTLNSLVSETIPPKTGFALRVFGNREADACRTDLEIPLAPHDPARAAGVIGGLTAVNLARTPIARSVALSAQDMASVIGERVLILITDGEETCDGDPAAAIQSLRRAGTDIRVNIVGYAIEDAALARTFESWAAAGGGEYFDAADGSALGSALVAATAPPFRVFDAAGTPVGAGIAGDDPLTLMPGDYVIRIGGQDIAATVTSEELTSVSPE